MPIRTAVGVQSTFPVLGGKSRHLVEQQGQDAQGIDSHGHGNVRHGRRRKQQHGGCKWGERLVVKPVKQDAKVRRHRTSNMHVVIAQEWQGGIDQGCAVQFEKARIRFHELEHAHDGVFSHAGRRMMRVLHEITERLPTTRRHLV